MKSFWAEMPASQLEAELMLHKPGSPVHRCIYNALWKRKNPKKAEKIDFKQRQKKKGISILSKNLIKCSKLKLSVKGDVKRMLSKGRDEVTIASMMGIPVSVVRKTIAEIKGEVA